MDELEYKYMTYSDKDTMAIAQNIESEKFPGMVICLNGELGSGKTMFVKGFAVGLGIEENITSPTFNIVKEYNDGEAPLYHMDVYRLEDDADSVGVEDYFNGDGVVIIEWADMIKDKLPEERLDIYFSVVDENTRKLKFVPHGKQYEDLCSSIL